MMKRTNIKGPYYIKWLDHHSFHLSRWRHMDEMFEGKHAEEFEIETVGWIVGEDETQFQVVSTINIQNDCCVHDMAVIKGCIVEMLKMSGKRDELCKKILKKNSRSSA